MTIPDGIVECFVVTFLGGLAWFGRRVERLYVKVALLNQRLNSALGLPSDDTDFKSK